MFFVVYLLAVIMVAFAVAGLAEFMTNRIERAIEKRRLKKYAAACAGATEWLGTWGA